MSVSSPKATAAFCDKCGAKTITKCPSCNADIRGYHHFPGIVDFSGFDVPQYCRGCGKPYPWTEMALTAAKEYTDDLDQLNAEEKTALKNSFDDLTSDTARTPLAASRFTKIMNKVGPVAQAVIQKTLETVITEAAKKSIGF